MPPRCGPIPWNKHCSRTTNERDWPRRLAERIGRVARPTLRPPDTEFHYRQFGGPGNFSGGKEAFLQRQCRLIKVRIRLSQQQALHPSKSALARSGGQGSALRKSIPSE